MALFIHTSTTNDIFSFFQRVSSCNIFFFNKKNNVGFSFFCKLFYFILLNRFFEVFFFFNLDENKDFKIHLINFYLWFLLLFIKSKVCDVLYIKKGEKILFLVLIIPTKFENHCSYKVIVFKTKLLSLFLLS